MAMAAVTLAAAGYQAYAANEAAGAQKALANKNADLIDRQSTDALARGEETAQRVRQQARATRSAQRVAYATQGVDVGSGTAADMQTQTGILGAIDEATVRKNAFREAYGLTLSANNQRLGGSYAAAAGRNQATGALLSGVGQSAQAYYQYDRPKVST